MQTEDFEDLNQLEETYWWFVGMRSIQESMLDPLLPPKDPDRSVLDVGCGVGGNMSWLDRYRGDHPVAGIDVEDTALAFCRTRGHRAVMIASATDLPVPDASVDLITMFDVLQQVSVDGGRRAFAEVGRVLAPGGYGLIRCAAYEWMRSGHDVAMASPHRYTLGEMIDGAETAGLQVVRRTYANTVLFPVIALRRLVLMRIGAIESGSEVKPLPASLQWANRVMTSVLRAEARFLRHRRMRLPFGLSAIIVVRQPDGP